MIPPGALCALPDADPEDWTGYRPERHAEAARTCMACPVARECAEQAESDRLNPPMFGQVPLVPWGVYAGRMYDGTRRAPLPVRTAETCAGCSRTFVPHHVQATRCDDCRRALAERPRRSRRQVAEHSTRSMFIKGCRCGDCRAAEQDYQRDRWLRTKAQAS